MGKGLFFPSGEALSRFLQKVKKMPEVEINDLFLFGQNADVEDYQLPPEVFTLADNMRFANQGAERISGMTQVFGTPGVAPRFAMTIKDASGKTFWLYTSLTKGYVFDGSTHTNITRQTAAVDVDYNASNTRDWNGTLLGGVPILNNGIDLPQFWGSLSTGTKLANLTNWPSTLRARLVRSFGPYLLALNVTKSGTNYPHMVKWSHPADPGSVPASWDETDPTKDAGERELPDAKAGVILDGLPLGGRFFVYKESSVWRVSQIGGVYIFDFGTSAFLEGVGILAPRCVTITGDATRHVFASQDDILVHDGNSVPQSILSERWKKTLRNRMDGDNYMNSFIYTDPINEEVVFCFPESGNVLPTRALVWNYRIGERGAISERVVPNLAGVTIGSVETLSPETWATITSTWSGMQNIAWSTTTRRKLVGWSHVDSKFYLVEDGDTLDGTEFVGTLQRTGLGIVGRKRNGDWIVDFTMQKLFRRLWVKGSGGPITVRIGASKLPGGPITWSPDKSFDPSTQKYLDFAVSGAALAVEFRASTGFRLQGYKIEFEPLGRF